MMVDLKNHKGVFITGTDTGVGKTIISAILTLGSKGTYWKPVQCGTKPQTDGEFVRQVTGLTDRHFLTEAHCLAAPLSPHLAASLEGVSLKVEGLVDLFPCVDRSVWPLVVEGAGGLLVPLNESEFMIDFMAQLKLPVILVARSTLGTINHTLMSLELLKKYGLHSIGVVLNGPQNPENKKAIEFYGNTAVLAEIEHLPDLTPQTLSQVYQVHFS